MASADLSDAIKCVVATLERAEIPYMFVGSVASSYHGTPRTTQDIDIVIDPTPLSLNLLLKNYDNPDLYLANRETALNALRTKSLFNVVEYATGWKLDFIFLKNEPFYIEEFQRRTRVEIYGTSAVLSSAEDVVIAKLLWAKMSESERQIRDVTDVMKTQQNGLDMNYIEKWVKKLALSAEYQKATRLM